MLWQHVGVLLDSKHGIQQLLFLSQIAVNASEMHWRDNENLP